MIRGFSKMKFHSQYRAPMLALLLLIGLGLPKLHASPMDADDFARSVEGQALAISPVPFPATAVIHASGRVEVQSALGTFHGRWVGLREQFCLYFDEGPINGETCVAVVPRADGSFAASDGKTLRPVASAYRF
ncbi:MAG: hypothetical protein AAFP13_00720 [Pseudomonadota bacterium]